MALDNSLKEKMRRITSKAALAASKFKGLNDKICLLYTSPSPRDPKTSRMPSSA